MSGKNQYDNATPSLLNASYSSLSMRGDGTFFESNLHYLFTDCLATTLRKGQVMPSRHSGGRRTVTAEVRVYRSTLTECSFRKVPSLPNRWGDYIIVTFHFIMEQCEPNIHSLGYIKTQPHSTLTLVRLNLSLFHCQLTACHPR